MNLPECDECRAVIADYVSARRALRREMLESRLGSDTEFAEAWSQARKLETEDDVVLAEQLFPAIQFRAASGVGLALSRIVVHETRSGHKVRRLLRPK